MVVTAHRAEPKLRSRDDGEAGTAAGLFRLARRFLSSTPPWDARGFFLPAPLRPLLQDEASTAKQRIGRRLDRADHRPDATPIDQPAPRARLPDAAGTLHDVRELLRAAHRHHATKLAKLNRTDTDGQGRGWRAHLRFSA